jgi:hypothetical protein
MVAKPLSAELANYIKRLFRVPVRLAQAMNFETPGTLKRPFNVRRRQASRADIQGLTQSSALVTDKIRAIAGFSAMPRAHSALMESRDGRVPPENRGSGALPGGHGTPEIPAAPVICTVTNPAQCLKIRWSTRI